MDRRQTMYILSVDCWCVLDQLSISRHYKHNSLHIESTTPQLNMY